MSGNGNGNKGGRPSKINSIDFKKVEYLAELGLTDEQMAKVFDISGETLRRYKENPEFCVALKKGKEISDNKVERSLYERANGYTHPEEKIFCNADGNVTKVQTLKHYPPDPASMIFWLKNRKPEQWRDRLNHEHTGKNGQPIVLKFSKEDEKL